MATAEELGGRRTPSFPGAKSDKTVTFVGSDGNEIEVVSNISKGALKLLKKQGFRKQSEVHKEQEEAALAKERGSSADDEDDEDDEDESPSKPSTPAKKAPAKAAQRST